MGNAENALGAQAFDQAGQAQKNALEALKEGAGRLAQELMKRNGQNNGRGEPNEDPLGRAEGAVGGAGSDTRLPNQTEMQRARHPRRVAQTHFHDGDRRCGRFYNQPYVL